MYNRGHALHTGRDKQNELSHKSKYSGKKKRSGFGFSAMSNMPLKDMNLARRMIDIIREISDACCTGQAQKHLKRLYGQFPKNLKTEMDLSLYDPKGREPKKFMHLRFLENLSINKTDSKNADLKRKPKYKDQKKVEDRAYKELLQKKERIRKAREKQLKAELSIKRKEKEEAKAKAEAEKKAKMRIREERRQ